MSDDVQRLTIMGSGPAGLTAAVYASRANLAPLVIEGGDISSKTDLPGGQLMLTTDVENYPGFPDGVQGPELMDLFKKQAARFGSVFKPGQVVSADLSERPFRLEVDDTYGGERYAVRTHGLIVATGASAKYLGLQVEQELLGRGVTTCATCDGAFFRDKKVAVVGGGDSAMEEALFLTRFAESVTIVHRREGFRASQIMLERARAHEKVRWKTNRVVQDIVPGDKYLDRLVLAGTNEDEGTTEELEIGPAGGLFVAIGHTPNSKVFAGQLEMDDTGYLETIDGSARTNVEGVFAAGDIHDNHYRQAVTAAGAGCRAAMDAEKWLEHLDL